MSAASWLHALFADARLTRLREAHRSGQRVEIVGLPGPARFLPPLLFSDTPLLVVLPAERDVETAAADLRTLAAEAGLAGSVLAFPAPGPAPFRGLPRHPDASLRRAAVLHAAARGRLRAVVASPAGLLRPCLSPRLFDTRVVALEAGEELLPELLSEALDEGGYRYEDPVTAVGQLARRGGILDFFPPDRDTPVRLEFVGDTIESVRSFDPETQRTLGELRWLEVVPLSDLFATRSIVRALQELLPQRFAERRDLQPLQDSLERGILPEAAVELVALVAGTTVPLWQHLQACAVVVCEPEAVLAEAVSFNERAQDERARHPDVLSPEPAEALVPHAAFEAWLSSPGATYLRQIDPEARSLHLAGRPARRYAGDLRSLIAELHAHPLPTVVFLGNSGRAARLEDVLREDGLATGEGSALQVRIGALSHGFELSDPPLRVLADGDVFPEEVHLHPRGRGRGVAGFLSDFRDLKPGDLVVHEDHGIGRFSGLETLEIQGARLEFMVLAYQGGDKLRVPVDSFHRVQKYASAEGARPLVDKLGSGNWDKVKRRVKKAMRDMAAELLKLYAERKARPGHAFSGSSPWQLEFEEAFEYEETRDQAAAIAEVAADMAKDAPMDRLVCGDVGYGKTEVAMRAAMRAVLDGKQVAVLSPTTVLAFQHWKTFRTRFAPFPVRIDMVSRFRTPKQIKEALAAVAAGKLDILIGTHRLLSKDVVFHDLGLLIVDEEQRFGVAAKERLKHLRSSIDCLTLSATPIPRTLQMGLAGLRDMSVIETPPKDRLAIHTQVLKFSTDVIATAIRQELAREGQVYLVHNRVESIYSLAGLVTRLVPEARVVVAHGQMPESQLEKAMQAFVEGRADVLVATTIIENGLDIPRANTLLVNRADRYGLAQLYQIRGRVGRSDRRAYAYLLVPAGSVLSAIARKRLAAMQEFSDLGAGFRIAALDLELRGAGNLLGGQQSGHIEAVGLDLYIKLLEQTILELKGQAAPEPTRATLNLGIELRIPAEYVPDVHQRMSLYKRVSQARAASDLAALRDEVRDRYGVPPPEVDGLLRYAQLRISAETLGLAQVDLGPAALHLRFATPPQDIAALLHGWPGASLTPQEVLRLPRAAAEPALAAVERALLRLAASQPIMGGASSGRVS